MSWARRCENGGRSKGRFISKCGWSQRENCAVFSKSHKAVSGAHYSIKRDLQTYLGCKCVFIIQLFSVERLVGKKGSDGMMTGQ